MKVLILGAAGMLGHKLFQYLSKEFRVMGTVLENVPPDVSQEFERLDISYSVDARNISSVEEIMKKFAPEYVINAIGIVKQKKFLSSDMIYANSLFPHLLESLCQSMNSKLITVSTDCVFSGRRGNYCEADIPDPVDLYGKTKLVGEIDYGIALTIRTSIIGPEIRNFLGLFEWFRSNAGKSVKGYKNAVYSGITTLEFAKIVENLIINDIEISGIYHVSSEPISKFDLLSEINTKFEYEIDIEPDFDFKCDRSLSSEKFWKDTGLKPSSWGEMLTELRDDLRVDY